MPVSPSHPGSPPTGLWWLPLLCLLAACGGGAQRARTDAYSPGSATYPEPGPPEDPWRPYIRDASSRFSVPQQWIRAVMRQESGGHEYLNGQPIVSGAGAMGLMQLMPATYADLQSQYSLGSDPFEPHDNILAGTAYISQMYRKYGAPAFLAAYNAGPQRLDDYLGRGRALPNETVDYIASIAPNLGTEVAMSGPLAAYATGGAPDAYTPPVQLAAYQPVVRRRSRSSAGCWHDPDAAFDPDAPCRSPPAAATVQEVPAAATVQEAVASTPPTLAPSALAYAAPSPAPYYPPIATPVAYRAGCVRNPDAAFDAPCSPWYGRPHDQAPPPRTLPAITLASAPMAPAGTGSWAIQVGAYTSVDQARFATTMARQADFALLAGSQSLVQPTTPFGHGTLYRARLAGLARTDAGQACATLSARSIPCMVVTPGT